MPQTNVMLVDVPPSEKTPRPFPSVWESYREELRRGLSHQGKVHTRRFWRLSTVGDTRVWRGSPEPSLRIHASAVLLWDWSASQNTFKDILIDSLNAIGAGLTELGFPVWAAAYTTGTGRLPDQPGEEVDYGTQLARNSKWTTSHERYWSDENPETTILAQVAEYGSPWEARRVQSLTDLAMCNTPTPWALGYVRKYILPSATVGKRLVIVCTDGESTDVREERREIERLRRDPENLVCGVYCGENHYQNVKNLYSPYALHISDRALMPQGFSQVIGFLRGGEGD